MISTGAPPRRPDSIAGILRTMSKGRRGMQGMEEEREGRGEGEAKGGEGRGKE